MGFGEPSKFDHARKLAAALAYIALNNLDRVGVSVFADGLGASLPPIKARNHLARLLAFLRELPCAGVTRFGTALRDFATRTRSPGLVILISDLLGAGAAQDGIEALCHGGHDVVVIQLLAESEIDPPLDGALRMVDARPGRAGSDRSTGPRAQALSASPRAPPAGVGELLSPASGC